MSSYEQARAYLARVLPWPQEGDGPAYVNVVWSIRKGDAKIWSGRAVSTLDAATNALKFAQKNNATLDIYVGQATMREAQERVSKNGYPYKTPVRLQENAVALKSLWLDLDIKEGVDVNGYPTVGEAIAALAHLVKETGLPAPNVIVSTGGGLHVYWVMDRALSPQEWYPLATALQAAGDKHGLKFDHVSADAARILRIPDTFNRKEEKARPVKLAKMLDGDYSVQRIEKALEPYKTGAVFQAKAIGGSTLQFEQLPTGVTPKAPLAGTSDLSAGIETAMPQLEVRTCLDEIPNTKVDWNYWNTIGMRVYAATEGADYGLEEWQRWSDKNSASGGKETCEARWQVLHTSPPNRTGAGALVNEVRAIKNDPAWSVRVPQAAPAAPAGAPSPTAPQLLTVDLPSGYVRTPAGIVCLVGVNEDGTPSQTPISDYPILSGWLQKDPWALHFDTCTERGKTTRVTIELEQVGGMGMRGLLQSQGWMMRISDKLTKEFFVAWVQKLQQSKDSVLSSPFGWSYRDGKLEGFVFDGKLFTPTAIKPAANPDPVLANRYKPTGDMQPWMDACDLVTLQGRPGLDAIIAASFAAPLVTFAGDIEGLLMCAWSDSGKGKTSTMRAAQSVWGHPKRAMEGLDDTMNSTFGKMGKTQSLPIFWDEIKTEEDTKNFVKLAFSLSKGREKNRMKQNTDLRESGEWKTLLVSCSNDSILDYVMRNTSTTTAGLYRVFEYELTPGTRGQIELPEAQRIFGALEYNFGHAGLTYAKFLGENFTQVGSDYATLADALATEIRAMKEERFWLVTLTSVLLGAKYANDLGLTDINEPNLKEFMVTQLDRMRHQLKSSTVDMRNDDNVSDLLAAFLTAMSGRHTLKTNHIHITRGKPQNVKIINDASRMDGCYVHMGQDDKLIRISSRKLSEWLQEKQISRTIFVKALEDLGMRPVKGRLGSGTTLEGKFTENLLEIPLAGSKFAKLIDEVQ